MRFSGLACCPETDGAAEAAAFVLLWLHGRELRRELVAAPNARAQRRRTNARLVRRAQTCPRRAASLRRPPIASAEARG